MIPDFLLYFNKRRGGEYRQWAEVYLDNVHPVTFKKRKGGRWAYFIPTWDSCNSGRFGELHFVKSRLRFDTISHEIMHMVIDWRWANGETFTRRNEERLIGYSDKMIWQFLKELKKKEPNMKLW